MTHVFALGHLMGRPGLRSAGRPRRGGAGRAVPRRAPTAAGTPRSTPTARPRRDKSAYAHAFVVLAAASATVAGRPGGRELLDEALEVLLDALLGRRARHGRRGVGRDVHDPRPLPRRQRQHAHRRGVPRRGRRHRRPRPAGPGAADRHPGRARPRAARHDWRIPEHFDEQWTPLLDYNVDTPAHPFRPVRRHDRPLAGVGPAGPAPAGRARRRRPRTGCSTTRVALFDASVREGWAVDGADGFVYTVDWDGTPVVRERMHWVAAEATATAAALHAATGDPSYADVVRHLVGPHRRRASSTPSTGSWRHELDPQNRAQRRRRGPASRTPTTPSRPR